MSAMRCLHHEAVVISGDGRPLDADTMFPILLYALVYADLPDLFSIIYILRNFSTGDYEGETAYYITCLEAAVSHLDTMSLPEDVHEHAAKGQNYDTMAEAGGGKRL